MRHATFYEPPTVVYVVLQYEIVVPGYFYAMKRDFFKFSLLCPSQKLIEARKLFFPLMVDSPSISRNQTYDDAEIDSLALSRRRKGGGFYDVTHPNADWSGYVPQPEGRKHFSSKEEPYENSGFIPLAMRDQITIAPSGDYFGPSSDATTSEWKRSGRKIAPLILYKDSVGLEESAKTETHWETEAAAAMNKNPTVLDQLTDFGRAIHIRGKKAVTPSLEMNHCQRRENCKVKEENASYNSDREQHLPYDLVGFRASETGCVETGKSFIESLGAQLFEQFKKESLVLPISDQVDPFEVANGRRKDLLLENYSNTTPGYTGNKTRNLYI
jgi:hypothetical protein